MLVKDDTVIKFKNVSKTYKLFKNQKDRLMSAFSVHPKYTEKQAINNVSFSIRKGESVAIFGRNGAGKSTILKMVTGVSHPSEGKVRVNGRVSAMLELTAGFNGELTGRENIYFRGELLGIKKAEIKAAEDAIIEFASLGEYIDQPVRMYSSGMKARLGFAVNINVKPEILIVDEALSVGDESFRNKCNAKVNELVSGGATFLFVTHSAVSAKKFCKRGLVLRSGRVVFDGEINEAAAFYNAMLKENYKI
ncbi:MAG: ABC transporter ATP-binding protein [Emergencia sp.]|nr:ABC transporter ATP-binding protein [Emergencia sp.]